LREGVTDRAVVEMRLESARRLEGDLERRRRGGPDGEPLRRRARDERAVVEHLHRVAVASHREGPVERDTRAGPDLDGRGPWGRARDEPAEVAPLAVAPSSVSGPRKRRVTTIVRSGMAAILSLDSPRCQARHSAPCLLPA